MHSRKRVPHSGVIKIFIVSICKNSSLFPEKIKKIWNAFSKKNTAMASDLETYQDFVKKNSWILPRRTQISNVL